MGRIGFELMGERRDEKMGWKRNDGWNGYYVIHVIHHIINEDGGNAFMFCVLYYRVTCAVC